MREIEGKTHYYAMVQQRYTYYSFAACGPRVCLPTRPSLIKVILTITEKCCYAITSNKSLCLSLSLYLTSILFSYLLSSLYLSLFRYSYSLSGPVLNAFGKGSNFVDRKKSNSKRTPPAEYLKWY